MISEQVAPEHLWLNLADLTNFILPGIGPIILLMVQDDHLVGTFMGPTAMDDVWMVYEIKPRAVGDGLRDAQCIVDATKLIARKKKAPMRTRITVRPPGRTWQAVAG